jgi:hypothetical protein
MRPGRHSGCPARWACLGRCSPDSLLSRIPPARGQPAYNKGCGEAGVESEPPYRRSDARDAPVKVAVYARVSTHDQTAENQLLELRRYVGRQWDTGFSMWRWTQFLSRVMSGPLWWLEIRISLRLSPEAPVGSRRVLERTIDSHAFHRARTICSERWRPWTVAGTLIVNAPPSKAASGAGVLAKKRRSFPN